MWRKRDQDFVELLDDPVKVEKRLTELASVRNWSVIAAIPMVILVFWVGFMILSGIIQNSGRLSPVTSWHINGIINSIFVLVTLLVCLSKAVSAHNELRMLLLFKKLRDDKSPVTP